MGLQIGEIVPKKEIQLSNLMNKTLAVDAFNTIYQFLSSIRQLDGTPLKDNKGNITSHLSGLFYRNMKLILENIKLVYVFDGKPPVLKKRTSEMRQSAKDNAQKKYDVAKKQGDIALMRRYSQQLTKLTDEMIDESKELLEAMGIEVMQAPSEGEAQAAHFAKRKRFYAIASQDYDSLLFGAPLLIQNLTLARKRKTMTGYVSITPMEIDLQTVLNKLQINHDQLICLGILCGTDYNPRGVKNIGPKKALDIVRKFKQPALIFKSVEENIKNLEEPFDWQEIFELFKKPEIEKNTKIKFPKIDEKKIKEILLKHDFSETRIDNQLEKLHKFKDQAKQKGLGDFI